MYKPFLLLLLALVVLLRPNWAVGNETAKRPRVIVMTDGEIDDQSSMIRFLLYSNEVDLQAIIETNSLFQRHGHSQEDWFEKQVTAYERVYPNLVKHSPNYPTATEIRQKSFVGDEDPNHLSGLLYIEERPGHRIVYKPDSWPNTPGSDRIVEVLLNADPSPVYIQAWGGGNTAAKAFYKLKSEYPAEYDRAIAKVVMYNIWYQDDAGNYIENYHPKVTMVYNSSFFGTWDYNSLPHTADFITHQVKNNHGPLGALYPQSYVSEGDTPAFLYTLDNGLRNYENPTFGGWGGRFYKAPNLANVYVDAQDDGDVKKPLKRWIEQANRDFEARLDWSVATTYNGANHRPIIKLNLTENLTVTGGQTITLNADGTTDPDGNGLSYRWWQYKDAGTYPHAVNILNSHSKTASLVTPTVDSPKTLHLILEVTDNGSPALVAYKRIILTLTTGTAPSSAPAPAPVPTNCFATGTILREQWNDIAGNAVSAIPVNTSPAATSQLTLFEGPTNVRDYYGSRIRGYICPPQTGNYTFYIASDDNAELWLSTDDNPDNKRKIAQIIGWTESREWNKFPSQTSATVSLQAGKRYYIEALQKDGNGDDNLAVGWQLPNGALERPIGGNRLAPFVVAPAPAPTPTNCFATGTILREQWNDIAGNAVSAIPVNTSPAATSQLTLFEGPTNVRDYYGSRIRGYICPPQTGNYTFYIASDDNAELWLSTDDNPDNKRKIAQIIGWTESREWNKFPSQTSATVSLQAGKRYYIEALQKDGNGDDNLAVGWQLPNGALERPIGGNRLAPFVVAPAPAPTPTNCFATGTILREQWNDIAGNAVSAIPVNTSPAATSQLTLFEGPTNVRDYYGSRIRGYICPPQTGNYTFYIASDDNAELWLSTDDNPDNKRKIAQIIGWTESREWNKFPSQTSATVSLQAGKRYYIEALQKDGNGDDNLAVGWQLPNGALERPIGGNRLAPFVPAENNILSVKNPESILLEQVTGEKFSFVAFPNPFGKVVNLSFTVPANETAVISIYTLQGAWLETVYTGAVKANQKNAVAWDGGKYASGVYIAKLTYGSQVVYKRLLLQR